MVFWGLGTIGYISAAVIGAAFWALVSRLKPNAPPHIAVDAHVFTFRNKQLVATSPTARAALSLEDLDRDVYAYLIERLSHVFLTLPDDMALACTTRKGFTLSETTKTGPVDISLLFDDDLEHLTVTGLDAPMARKTLVDQDRADAIKAELTILRSTAEAVPVAMWRYGAKGQIDWVNGAYMRLLEDTGRTAEAASWPPPNLFDDEPAVIDPTSDIARKSLDLSDGRKGWYQITKQAVGDATLHCAVDASATVWAEDHLRTFTQTLTQTFASLPTGLAVFDRDRRLVMFNPAYVTLTRLDPAWLSARPTLSDMLDRMREARMVPEQKNFSDWRRKLCELEQLAREGHYSETWTLPTGLTYRITGHPYPKGAVAFLLEDITSEITLKRHYRQQLDLNKSLFNSLPDAIAIFSRNGMIETCNQAYAKMWGVELDASDAERITDAMKVWQTDCAPTPIWDDLRDFMSQHGERAEWYASVDRLNGQQLNCRFAPLLGGATLASFSPVIRPKIARPIVTERSAMTG